MKTVCFFTGNMSRGGGTEHMTQLLANRLVQEENYKVFVLSKSDNDKSSFYELDSGIIYSALDNSPYRGAITVLKDIYLLYKFIKKNKIDILINVDVALGLFSLPLKLLRPKLKQIFWEHFCVKFNVGNKHVPVLRRTALRWGNAYVTLTPEDSAELTRTHKRVCRILDIPNICTYNKSQKPYNSDSKTIISVGNLIKAKGFDFALTAAAKVFEKHPDWTWEFYGDGSEEKNLRLMAQELKIEKNVRFMGRVKDLRSAYENASFFVLTSRSEGFGLVLVEAQSYLLPTVAFDVPFGPVNIIADNQNGYLIEPFDTDKLAAAICKLIENAHLRKSFSESAANDLWRYTADHILSQWKNLFDEI